MKTLNHEVNSDAELRKVALKPFVMSVLVIFLAFCFGLAYSWFSERNAEGRSSIAQVETSLDPIFRDLFLQLDESAKMRLTNTVESINSESSKIAVCAKVEHLGSTSVDTFHGPYCSSALKTEPFEVVTKEVSFSEERVVLTVKLYQKSGGRGQLFTLLVLLLASLSIGWLAYKFFTDRAFQFIVSPLLDERRKKQHFEAIARTTQNLAHDVRKPFSMLKLVLGAISDADDPSEAKEIAEASLPEVNQAMASVEGMIQDVMQIGSNSAPNQEVASCEAMIDAAVNELFRIFPEADVGIEYSLDHEHCLFIDTMRVGRVFSNILVNAVQAMNGKGTLWIKTHEENGFVEFRLGNVGSCIPKDSLLKLFDAFFTSGKKGGTGLGLAIAQKVVNEHGGSIRCESDQTEKYPSGYVEFVLTLPVASELSLKRDEPLPNHSRVIHEQLSKLKKKDSDSGSTDDLEQERIITKRLKTLSGAIPPVLIVDDEAVYRNSLAGLLKNFRGGESDVAKIPIVFAKNAADAMQMVKEHSPFLIIQDIDLGGGSKNGIDVIKDLRQLGYKGRICVHSNRFLFDDQKTAVEAGADSVLPKPMSRAHFFKLISSSLPIETGAKTETPAIQKSENRKPRIAYIDDAITFTLSWKMKLRDKIDVETFTSTTNFFKKTQEDKGFLQGLDVIVTDYYFGNDDPLNGKSFAAELRKLGFTKPIFLASNGDSNDEDFKPDLNGVIGKEVPSVATIQSWLH